MSQIFIQTDSKVIDISKIIFIDTSAINPDTAVIVFDGAASIAIPMDEAAALLDAMSKLRDVQTIRAASFGIETPAASPPAKPPRKRRDARVANTKEADRV